ncbi:MAG: iron-containing alcohol dehydrogenase [Acidobacteriota bacterium]|nr:iron-containing alcohol dehydrogenase [Acidobacteriota bacterium]
MDKTRDDPPALAPWEAEVGSVRIVAGPGRIAELASIVARFEVLRVLVVTDSGLQEAGHVERAVSALGSGFETWVFDGVEENPNSAHVQSGTALAREHGIELIVAIGGGSALDCAKAINFLLTNGGKIEDYWGFGKAQSPMLPSVAIPATAGTGSEAQSYALITQAGTGRKMACGDLKARPRAVVLDPEVAVTAPRSVAAQAGLDALSHAVESMVTTRRNPVSTMLAREAWRILAPALATARDHRGGDSLAAVARLQLGAHLAGAAIESSMLGAAHAAANPLTTHHQIVHGEAVALMLPHVVRFNAQGGQGIDDLYRQLESGSGSALAGHIEKIRHQAGLAEQLRQCGVEKETLPELARAATEEWTGRFNPRDVTEKDFLRLYEAAY